MRKLIILCASAFILVACNKKSSKPNLVTPPKVDSTVYTDIFYGTGDSVFGCSLPQMAAFDSVFLKATVSQHGNTGRIDDFQFNGLQEGSTTSASDYNNTLIWRIGISKYQYSMFIGTDSIDGAYREHSTVPELDTIHLSVVYYKTSN